MGPGGLCPRVQMDHNSSQFRRLCFLWKCFFATWICFNPLFSCGKENKKDSRFLLVCKKRFQRMVQEPLIHFCGLFFCFFKGIFCVRPIPLFLNSIMEVSVRLRAKNKGNIFCVNRLRKFLDVLEKRGKDPVFLRKERKGGGSARVRILACLKPRSRPCGLRGYELAGFVKGSETAGCALSPFWGVTGSSSSGSPDCARDLMEWYSKEVPP
jgi:hypothetical protein